MKQEKPSNDEILLSTYPVIKPSQGSYIWSAKITVKCNSPITYLECRSHKAKLIEGANSYERTLQLDPSDEFQNVFNKNLDILFSYTDINKPTYRLAKSEQGFCAMIDFLPRYDEETLDDAIIAAKGDGETAAASTPDDVNILTATGEYIFLIDRSGSMSGSRLTMAKEALLFPLKSLPPKSYFNIYSFGSTYSAMYLDSIESHEKNVNQAIEKVKQFSADLGGTEIYPPIHSILSKQRKKNHPRTLFLLTDGEVSDPEKVIKLIRSNNHRARVFSLGIGNGCSEHLVTGCATAGMGKSVFVFDSKDISGNVILLMEAAFTPVCDDFALEFSDKEVVNMFAPDPQSLSYLLRNQMTTFYIFLNNAASDKGEFEVTLKYFNTSIGGYSTSTVKLNLKEYETGLDLFKLGIGEAADILEKKKEESSTLENRDIWYAVREGIDAELVRLSVENQVLTKKTAFICVVKQNGTDEIATLDNERIVIPQTQSVDYYEPQVRSVIGNGSCSVSSGYSDEFEEDMSDDDNCYGARYDARKKAEPKPEAEEDEDFGDGLFDDFYDDEPAQNTIQQSLSVSKSNEASIKESMEESKTNTQQVPSTKATNSNSSEKAFLDIVQSQKALGFWDLDAGILAILGITKAELLLKIPKEVKEAKGDLEQMTVTLAILVWMEKYFADKKSSWTLIHKKGVQYLKNCGLKYPDLVKEMSFI